MASGRTGRLKTLPSAWPPSDGSEDQSQMPAQVVKIDFVQKLLQKKGKETLGVTCRDVGVYSQGTEWGWGQ